MNLPEAVMAALPLKADGQVVVVGDHRQMPPIVHHDWEREYRRTFRQYEVYTSLFDTLRQHNPPMIQFAESFRLHAAMADFLREEVYRHDGIHYHSRKRDLLPARSVPDEFVAAVLRPEYPLVVVVHDEAGSQVRNPFEQALIEPLIRVLADRGRVRPGRGRGPGHRRPAPITAGGVAAGVPGPVRDRRRDRPAGEVGHRHGGAVPGRRADGDPGECDRERPGIPARCPASSCSTLGG